MKSGENFNPENYNAEEEFWKIVSEVAEPSKTTFNPPKVSASGSKTTEKSLNIPNFKIPEMPTKKSVSSPEVPNFASNRQVERVKEQHNASERHESQRKNINFGQKTREVIDFTKKFNRAMKIHARRFVKRTSEQLSEKTAEKSEKVQEILSGAREKISEKSDSLRDFGKKSVAIALVATTIGTGFATSYAKDRSEKDGEEAKKIEYETDANQNNYGDFIFEEEGDGSELTVSFNEKTEPQTVQEVEPQSNLKTEAEAETEENIENVEIPISETDAQEEFSAKPTPIEDEPGTSEQENEVSTETNSESTSIVNDMNVRLNLTDSMKQRIEKVKEIYKENYETYKRISDKVKADSEIFVPPELICAIHERESGCNFDTYLQNGDPLGKPTVHFPQNIPVYYNFVDSAVAAIEEQFKGYPYDQELYVKGNSINTMSKITKMANRYNGVSKHVSSYVWSGSEKYQGGMYVADFKYDATKTDERPGVYALVSGLMNVDLS